MCASTVGVGREAELEGGNYKENGGSPSKVFPQRDGKKIESDLCYIQETCIQNVLRHFYLKKSRQLDATSPPLQSSGCRDNLLTLQSVTCKHESVARSETCKASHWQSTPLLYSTHKVLQILQL